MKNNILIIGDDTSLQQTLCYILHRGECRTITAKIGLNVLDMLRNYPIDLVVLDLISVNDYGLSLFFKIKSLYPYLPVITLSSNRLPDPVPGTEKEFAWANIVKPFDPELVLSTTLGLLSSPTLSENHTILMRT